VKSKTRRCAHCKTKCDSEKTIQSQLRSFCSYECLKSFSDAKTQKDRKKAVRELRMRHKTRSDHIREAQTAFNAYIRFRDRNVPCISCGRWTGEGSYGGNWDCSHYRSVGSAPHLRFHQWNAHKSCVKCNRWLSGNISDYRVALVWKIGQPKVDFIESCQEFTEITAEYAQRIKRIFRKKKRIKEKIINKKRK